MNKRNTLLTFVLFLGIVVLASCTGQSSNTSNSNTQTGYTANRIDATREGLNNLKTNANQRATAIDSLASGNSNTNSY
jgi:hypothetical protein